MFGGQPFEVVRIVGEDEPSTEPDSGGYNERVDGHLAAGADGRQEMTSDAGDTNPRRNDAGVTPPEFKIDSFVGTTAAVELD